MDKDTRNAIDSATQRARRLLEADFTAQLDGDFDIQRSGAIAAKAGPHLSARQAFQREKIAAAIEHKRAAGMSAAEAVADYLRDAAFTSLNRFVALKMLEARELVQECVTKGEQSAGYREFCGMAPGLPLLPDSAGYRLYLESLFDELSTEVKVLFDRRDVSSVLWPRRSTFEQLLGILNAVELAGVWGEDETIGWMYQYFNSLEERQAMKDTKSGGAQAPRNSRELATRNQFFTPRYIVRFLTDNTLGRLWWEMREGNTVLRERCESLAIKPTALPAPRTKKDPRDIRIIDPACGSGHFLLYVFDLLLCIYDEAWADADSPASEASGATLRVDFPSPEALHAAVPELIIRHNLFGIDIDPRCVQLASFALWLRAQRAWSDSRVPRLARPRIEQSQVILAEPMPGDPKLVQEFASQLGHPVLATLFEKIVEAFKLAGDLGILLRVERLLEDAIRDAERLTRQGTLFGTMAPDREFWDTAEDQLLTALARFANGGPDRASERRRLFRHDSAHGLALLHAARTKFDVVLMNPPFGDPSGPSKSYIEGAYPDSRQDIFAVFVDRCVRDLANIGFVGVISTEAGFFRRTLEPWRRNVLLAQSRMEVMAHLGGHVLDGATVRVAAYTLATGQSKGSSQYLRLIGEHRHSREDVLQTTLDNLRTGVRSDLVFDTDQREFEKLPYAVFGYWCSPKLRDVFVNVPALEGSTGHARQGLATADDFRFLRLRWEVAPTTVRVTSSRVDHSFDFTSLSNNEKGRSKSNNSIATHNEWRPFAKGGEYSPFYDDVHLVVVAPTPRSSLAAFGGSYIRNADCYGKAGLTWPPRTNKRFAPRLLPRGCVFGHKGPAVVDVPDGDNGIWALLAVLNSRVVGYLMGLALGASEVEGGTTSNSYEVGLVQRLPIHNAVSHDTELVAQSQRAWTVRADTGLRDEVATSFASPVAPCGIAGSLVKTWGAIAEHKRALLAEYIATQHAIDHRTVTLYGLQPADWVEIEGNMGDVHRPEVTDGELERRSWVECFVSFLVGCAFGRYSPDRLRSAHTLSSAQAFEPPVAHRDEATSAPFLLDDPGHAMDLVARCEGSLAAASGVNAHLLINEACVLLGVPDLRFYVRSAFFDAHRTQYTKSRRTAPIYLPIGAPSGGYSIWLYLHRVGVDTLFTLQSEVVTGKLRLEEQRLAAFARAGQSRAADQKALAGQEAFVYELRAFLDEVKRVAPLWKPNLDDGVIINFAPLWRLVPQHKAWQKELKATWDTLCEGKYDWAHLAMHLWPERVVPKCATDRSFAIAHGLEEVFWTEGSDGKWNARKAPTRPIEELVEERTSPAVKAALKSLLEAPVAAGGSNKSRKGKSHA